jgi:hypothetical protein
MDTQKTADNKKFGLSISLVFALISFGFFIREAQIKILTWLLLAGLIPYLNEMK